MRKVMVAVLSAIVVGLMLVPSGVSAGITTVVVQDRTGDLGFGVNGTGEISKLWADNAPVAQAKYLDMASAWLSQKAKTYTFGMELAAALPKEGSALPGGIKLVEWAVWIDPSPYNVNTNPVLPLFLIALRYDGSSYSAFVLDRGTMVTTSVPFSIDGSKLQLQFSEASIGNRAFEWWSPMVREWTGPLGTSGYWFVDAVDYRLNPGQVYYDIPWPPG